MVGLTGELPGELTGGLTGRLSGELPGEWWIDFGDWWCWIDIGDWWWWIEGVVAQCSECRRRAQRREGNRRVDPVRLQQE